MSLAPELTIAERYTLVERIAVGGMGEVWRARDQLLDRDVAVKVLKEEYAEDPTFLQRFRNEARHTAGLSHPGIAGVFDYGEIGNVAYIVMEYVPGEPLSALITREAPLPPERVLNLLGQAALALQAAHDIGVVHRDVKPGNLLVRPDDVIKVTDFGIARAVDSAPVTQTGLLVGTAAYLSPEQAAGRPATGASDIYSLGVVGYECLTGTRPFTGDSAIGIAMAHVNATPAPLPSYVPALVADFVMRALDKDPARRQPSAGDFGRTALALAGQLRQPATQVLPTDALPVATEPHAATTAMHADDERERRRIRNIFVAVGAAVVILGFLLLRSCTNSGIDTARVPKVVGETYAQAVQLLRHRGFDVHRTGVPRLRVPVGMVVEQSARPGAELQAGSVVTLDVSTGPASVVINAADYIGQPVSQVTAALSAQHLDVQLISQSSDQPPGTVVGVEPTGSLPQGTAVTVMVAAAKEGPKPPNGHVPPGHDKHKGPGD